MPDTAIEIVEVAPRDGLQNEKILLSLEQKAELVTRLIDCGARRLEVGSFVNPRKVPQMAGTDELLGLLPRRADVTYIGLVMNMRGLERALAAGIDEAGAVCVATDSFAMRNQGQTCEGSVTVAGQIVRAAIGAGRSAQVTIAAAFGCPFEGEVPEERVVAMAARLCEASPREIALADTIGVAVPAQVSRLVRRVRAVIGAIPVRVHLHNTRNTGIANAWAAVEAGARTLDAALGGIGGCPFAPNATGNIATEDLLYMLARSGIATGYDLSRTIEQAQWLEATMNKPLPALVSRAGIFPPTQKQEA
ncbi:hydroxymethylglutaryl-CoA lyase [Novosphingobium panipatense]|uniref:Hydroxymethylglutaryl-CoA lyase n=1 Tax=Novosphingobium panipatense TaxID=428991 RepID=A0ABY1QHY8_9SPHN|nr:hydroxymethylglutaryl-CoA lyase [Novosphingobium panipatense]SMP71541.1 hydroxymethylglutaryl-CoA lyase [Novosphingobium panipatense]